MELVIVLAVVLGGSALILGFKAWGVPWYRKQLKRCFEWRLAGPHSERAEERIVKRMNLRRAWEEFDRGKPRWQAGR